MREGEQGSDAAIHQFLPFLERVFAAVHATFGGGEHLVGLFVGEVVSVDRAAEQCGILGVGDGGFRLRQLRPRGHAGLHQGAQTLDSGLGAHDFRRVLSLCKHTAYARDKDQARKKTHEIQLYRLTDLARRNRAGLQE